MGVRGHCRSLGGNAGDLGTMPGLGAMQRVIE